MYTALIVLLLTAALVCFGMGFFAPPAMLISGMLAIAGLTLWWLRFIVRTMTE